MRKPRIILADDHSMLTELFEGLLTDNYEIVDRVGDGRTLIEAVAHHQPDAIVVDISMPLLNGLDAIRLIKKNSPDVKIIVLTVHETPEIVTEAFRRGVAGYVLKNSAASELIVAIGEALRGRSYVTPLVAKEMVDSFIKGPQREDATAGLTPRQSEVIQLLAEGRTMKQVAKILEISPRTVAFHKYRVMDEQQIHSNAELIRFAIKNNLAGVAL
jgi:DNA-binding NarL/FixJ family response regulator